MNKMFMSFPPPKEIYLIISLQRTLVFVNERKSQPVLLYTQKKGSEGDHQPTSQVRAGVMLRSF